MALNQQLEFLLAELNNAILPSIEDPDFIKLKDETTILTIQKEEIEQLISHIDLTTLAGDDTKSRVAALVKDAINPIEGKPKIKCASICVYPARILDAKISMEFEGFLLPISSVAAGFPSGQYHLESRLMEIELAIRDGATEIDAVINRTAVLDGQWDMLFEEIRKMAKACCGKAKLKIILSTGELGNAENIYNASMTAMFAGADFIKTSTGKEIVNATPEAAYLMCHAIRRYHSLTNRKVGFKAAGGIRGTYEAMQYKLILKRILGDGWAESNYFRIGASKTLLDNLRTSLACLF